MRPLASRMYYGHQLLQAGGDATVHKGSGTPKSHEASLCGIQRGHRSACYILSPREEHSPDSRSFPKVPGGPARSSRDRIAEGHHCLRPNIEARASGTAGYELLAQTSFAVHGMSMPSSHPGKGVTLPSPKTIGASPRLLGACATKCDLPQSILLAQLPGFIHLVVYYICIVWD